MGPLILLLVNIVIAQANLEDISEQPLNTNAWVNTSVFQYNFYDNGQPPILSYIHQYRPKPKPVSKLPQFWMGSSTWGNEVENQFYPGVTLPKFELGLGPRRRRKRGAFSAPKIITKAFEHLLEMPLFCWKIYVNCLAFPNHICCPVSYNDKAKRKTRAAIFDIPMSLPKQATKRSDLYQTSNLPVQRQQWKPYSPYYIGLKGYEKPQGNQRI